MGRKQKCPDCPPEGAPSYMLTYGDMMTLLLTFFVLLISFSSIQESEFHKAMRSLQGALGVLKASGASLVNPTNIGNYDFPESAQALMKDVGQAIEQLKEITEKTGTHDMVQVEASKDRIHFVIANPMLFGSGTAELKSEANEVLGQIANVLQMVPYEVRVEGHTDNIPISTSVFPSNWELSAARASSVVKQFVAAGVDPSRFLAVGFGEYRPVADNSTEEGRALNRRVEIFVSLKSESVDESLKEEMKSQTNKERMP